MKEKITKKICWIDGYWILNEEIKLSPNDRGLNLSDGIFETILILQNQPQLLTAHLNRWSDSAKQLGMKSPPEETWLIPLINEAINRMPLSKGFGALRLNWSRGDNNNRGINLSTKKTTTKDHKFWLELNEYHPSFNTITTMISRHERRNAHSKLSQYKTFGYLQSIQARYESNLAGYDDALLLSTNGEIACGTTANLLIRRNNEWLTPRVESGCLPGIMRKRGLDAGLFKEATISPKPKNNDQWLLINSLNCHSITRVNNIFLSEYKEAKTLWQSLIVQ